MSAASVLGLLVPGAIFVALAMAVVLLGLLQYRLAAWVSAENRAAVAILVVGVGALLSVALTARNLNEDSPAAAGLVLYEDFASGFAASRWLSLLLLGTALVETLRGFLRARLSHESDPAWPVLLAMLMFFFGTLAVQAFLSEHVSFALHDLYVPVLLLAVYQQHVHDMRRILSAAKLATLALILGSLIGIAVQPDFVLHRPAPGIIPGIDWRLFGLTSHANTLGPIALLGVLLELYAPSRWRSLRWAHLASCVAALVLAQSRTAWGAALLMAIVVWLPLRLAPARGAGNGAGQGTAHGTAQIFARAVWTVVGGLVLLIVAACVFAVSGTVDDLHQHTDLGTLNGRFAIWAITLQAWQENVMFGYGAEVWGTARRLRFNLFHVGQAHNQLLQTLGEAGIAGLLLLAIYLLVLVQAARRGFRSSRGFGMALLLLLLARCVTESPMRAEGLLSWATFLHVLLLLVLCHHLRGAIEAVQPSPAWRRRAVAAASARAVPNAGAPRASVAVATGPSGRLAL